MPWVPIYLGVIFLFHWTLGLVACFGALVILCLALTGEFLTRRPIAEGGRLQARSNAFANLSHRNAEVVTAMGLGRRLRERWQALHGDAKAEQTKAGDRGGGLSAGSKAFRLFLQSAILAAGAVLAVHQVITPGAMIAASIIMGRALAPIDQAIGQWKNFVAARQAYGRLKALLQALPPPEDRLALPEPQGHLQVDRVFATPPGQDRSVLNGIDFALKPGQALGVIGPSAAGKSSLARLLVGVWLPSRGSVQLDGAALDLWDREQLGPHIGYLPQDVELFDGTVKDNIARFDPEASDEAILEAAKRADVHHMILQLADGYETVIGENGAHLSGGQRQRLALARALYGDPALVVLDEPNANLDAEGDAALTRAIQGLKERGKTTVVMTHRPSAIAAVDQLLMLKEGAQVAFGPKEQVLRQVTQVAAASGPATSGTATSGTATSGQTKVVV